MVLHGFIWIFDVVFPGTGWRWWRNLLFSTPLSTIGPLDHSDLFVSLGPIQRLWKKDASRNLDFGILSNSLHRTLKSSHSHWMTFGYIWCWHFHFFATFQAFFSENPDCFWRWFWAQVPDRFRFLWMICDRQLVYLKIARRIFRICFSLPCGFNQGGYV